VAALFCGPGSRTPAELSTGAGGLSYQWTADDAIVLSQKGRKLSVSVMANKDFVLSRSRSAINCGWMTVLLEQRGISQPMIENGGRAMTRFGVARPRQLIGEMASM